MKVFCLCAGGVSRSVGLAFVLKYHYGHDAIAGSYEKNSPETIDMLCQWADRVITVMPSYVKYIPEGYHYKTTVYNLGLDRWLNALHPDMHQKLKVMIAADPLWNDKGPE